MAEETLFCLRVRYVETGRLKYLSHLELLRALERTIHRAGLPYAVTQGFTPRIKAAYGPALPVGVASRDEWFDLWLRDYRPADEYLAALRRAAPVDLAPQQAAYVDLRAPSLSAALTLSTWDAEIGLWDADAVGDGRDAFASLSPADVERAFAAVVERGSIEYMRSGKPKTVQLAGKIARAPRVEALEGGAPGARAVFTTRSSGEGALRPDVVLGAVVGQLAETFAVQAAEGRRGDDAVVSFKRCLRTSVVRTAQYLEREDGTWARPI